MAREPRRVYPVSEIAHLWASYNRGDTTLDHARSGTDREMLYQGAYYRGAVFYSEGGVSAVQRTAKSKARYVLAVPGRKHRVGGAVGAGNGRLIELPYNAMRGPYSDLRGAGLMSDDLDMARVVKALIGGNTLRYVTEARWLAKHERLSFPALLKEVLDADETDAQVSLARQNTRNQELAERKARQAREAAERAANDRNPLVRALRGVGAAAMEADRQSRQAWQNVLGWMADLSWLAGHSTSRGRNYGRTGYGTPHRPTLLRVNRPCREGDARVIETSQGAQFPAAHGEAAWPFILRARQRGERWEPKATTGAVLGHYKINYVREDGSVVAGCHDVPFWSAAYAHFALQPGQAPEQAMRLACELVARGPGSAMANMVGEG